MTRHDQYTLKIYVYTAQNVSLVPGFQGYLQFFKIGLIMDKRIEEALGF